MPHQRQKFVGGNRQKTISWMKLEGLMDDRHITCKVGGTICGTCVSLGLYDIDITAIAKSLSDRVQVCENKWVW